MAMHGRVESLSLEGAFGWATIQEGRPTYVYASLDQEVLGIAPADVRRKDLSEAEQNGTLTARAFVVLYYRQLRPEDAGRVVVRIIGEEAAIEARANVSVDVAPPLRVFILGSPRSGTSELGHTLSTVLRLRWLGETHAAERFARAGEAFAGNENDRHEIPRFMARQNFEGIAVDALKRAYFWSHSSASFLDKTPGIPMIKSAPFLAKCFPNAKFVYLYRNGISNVLSRMAKFGGRFESHCEDWASAIRAWENVKATLPSSIEIRQEDMLAEPRKVAARLAEYLSMPETADPIAASLETGTMERTGAGLNRDTFAATGWSEQQIERFRAICGSAMRERGYAMD